MSLQSALSDQEIDELEDFLASEAIEDTSMDVATLEGLLTALAIGPRLVQPSEWLPWVWDMQEGIRQPEFESEAQVREVLDQIMRLSNSVINALADEAQPFEPLFWRARQWGAGDWCEGFLLGLQFNDELWDPLTESHPEWFKPFLLPGDEDALDLMEDEVKSRKWLDELSAALVSIRQYWLEKNSGTAPVRSPVRTGPKVGRNDPCPCGSGKKFKQCCGQTGTPPVLH